MSEFTRPGVNPGINPIEVDPNGFSGKCSAWACFEGEFNGNLQGERGLLAAIVWRAHQDLKLPRRSPDHRSARCFFLSPARYSKHRYTFIYCCEHLNISPYKVLRFLVSKRLLSKI